MMKNVQITLLLGWFVLATAARHRESRDLNTNLLFPFPSGAQTIVNGQDAVDGDFPFYAVFSGGVLCGGALVHEDIVLTAAHCIDGGAPPAVRIGGTTSGNGELIDVADNIIHPAYRANTLENDIAILILAEPSAAPVAEYNADDASPGGGAAVVAMGFGRTDPNSGGGSSTLKKLDMDVVGDDECSERYGDHEPSFNICVDNNDGGICFGDSGGPLVDANGLVLGVASFIIQTCDSNFPDFYTRVSSYSTWLERSVCEESANPPADGSCENVGDDDGPGGGDTCFLDILIDICTALTGILFG